MVACESQPKKLVFEPGRVENYPSEPLTAKVFCLSTPEGGYVGNIFVTLSGTLSRVDKVDEFITHKVSNELTAYEIPVSQREICLNNETDALTAGFKPPAGFTEKIELLIDYLDQ